MDLAIEVPGSALDAVMAHEVWEEYYDRLAQLIAAHRTTLIFVNTRRIAERAARHLSERIGEDQVTAHHGSLSKAHRLDAEHRLEDRQAEGRSSPPLLSSSASTSGTSIWSARSDRPIASPRCSSDSAARVTRSAATPKGRLMPVSRDDLVECVALLRSVPTRRARSDPSPGRSARRPGAADHGRDRLPRSTVRTS